MICVVREFHIGDLIQVAEIYRKAFSQEIWAENWSVLDAEKRIRELTCYPQAISYVYEFNGRIVGCITGAVNTWHSGMQLEIKELFVDPQLQSKGIGTKLLKAIEVFAQKQRISEILLWTLRGEKLQNFYLECDYRPVLDTIIMKKNMEV